MENKIKTLYILSIVAILAFLVMQVYWLYARYEYSLKDYEDKAELTIAKALEEYDKARAGDASLYGKTLQLQSVYNMNHGNDSTGSPTRSVTVTTKVCNYGKMLHINEPRTLTPEEIKKLEQMVLDSLEAVEIKKMSLDVTSAPSDGVAWNAMKNFEREIQSPFSVAGLDSMLAKDNIHAEISLIVTDSLMWKPVLIRHSSLFSPQFKFVTPYSELEFKAAVVACHIPTSAVLKEMGWTLVMACMLSLFLIVCLLWQIKTIARLTRLDKLRSSFITTMIHELKRPISTLKMCVSGIDNEKLMEDARLRHELAGEIRIALDNLSAYFSRLRDITFNNVDQIPLNITSFNLNQLVDEVLGSIAVPATKHVEFKNDIAEGLEISADRAHMINIITNMIENAIKYSGEEVSVAISAEATADGVIISIADNGYGIPAADQNKIFNRFYRGKASATDIPGMGLGLAYVKLLVDAHGGDILVESAEGVGSNFKIRLPQ